jgi:hypothetical protein
LNNLLHIFPKKCDVTQIGISRLELTNSKRLCST